MAELINNSGVRTVVLNACNSGNQPLDPNVQSLAYKFLSKGISEVVAMSYAVMKNTAADFMTAFYKVLLEENSTTAQAVYQGRNYLRMHTTKEGRFTLPVEVHDDFLPVLYQLGINQRSFLGQPNKIPNIPGATNPDYQESCDARASLDNAFLGRENDLLALETAMSEYSVVRVIGDHGVGKTYFANQLSRWWQETGFVDHFFAIEFAELSESTIETILQHLDQTMRLPGTSADQSRVLVCIDNFDARKQDDISNEKRKIFHDSVCRLKIKHPCCMWLLFCCNPGNSLAIDEFSVVEYSLDGLGMDEAYTLLNNHDANEEFEEFLDLHDGNPLTLHLLGSLLPIRDMSSSTVLQQLKFGLPPIATAALETAFQKNDELRNRDSTKPLQSYFNGISNTLNEFQKLMKALKGHSQLAFQIALSLAVFQRTMPVELQSWVAWLSHFGNWPTSGSDSDASPSSNKATKTAASKEEESPQEHFEASTETQQCVTWVLDKLLDFGFVNLPSSDSIELAPKYLEIHPLLSYLLRYEIVMHQDARLKIEQLPLILWQMYELQIASLLKATAGKEGLSGVPEEVKDFLEAEHTNIYNAVEACLQQPEFGFQEMKVLGILLSEGVVGFYHAQATAQARLLDHVLIRFEALYQEQNYRSTLTRLETRRALAMIMTLAWFRGNTLLAVRYYTTALDNAERGLHVLKDLAVMLPRQADLNALRFAFQCQAASVPSISKSKQALQQLLDEERPAGLDKIGTFVFDSSKLLIRTRYLQLEGEAVGTNPVQQQAAFYAHVLQIPGVQHLVPDLDILLSKLKNEELNEKQWLTEIRPALAAAFVKAGYRIPYSAAAVYIWKSILLRTNMGPDRESLQRAVEVAQRTGDLESEITGLDGLFLLARGEDIEAAIKIHERLVELEQVMAPVGLTWQRAEASERNSSIGIQMIPSKDIDPDARDLYRRAQPYFQRAIQVPRNHKQEQMQILYLAHMGLRFCANFTHDRTEYVLNTLEAMKLDHLMSHPRESQNWGQGQGMKWIFKQYETSEKISILPEFITQVADVIKRDPAEVTHILSQCMTHATILRREESKQALEETQNILFSTATVDTANLKYWQRAEQYGWTLDTSKLATKTLYEQLLGCWVPFL